MRVHAIACVFGFGFVPDWLRMLPNLSRAIRKRSKRNNKAITFDSHSKTALLQGKTLGILFFAFCASGIPQGASIQQRRLRPIVCARAMLRFDKKWNKWNNWNVWNTEHAHWGFRFTIWNDWNIQHGGVLGRKSLPPRYQAAEETLPPAATSKIQMAPEPVTIDEPADTVDQASVRTKRALSAATIQEALAEPEPTPTPQKVSRTTEWRRRRALLEGTLAGNRGKGPAGGAEAPRKEYSSRICSQSMSTEGHTQFRGQRYCPNAHNQVPKDEWLKLRRAEAAAKKQAKQSQPHTSQQQPHQSQQP